VRTVGLLVVSSDQNFITNQIWSGAAGCCIVRESARAAGLASMPQPFIDASDDVWLWHQFFAGIIDDRADSDILTSMQIPIDSRAQRKVADGDAIVFLIEGGGESDGFDAALYVRLLLKLH